MVTDLTLQLRAKPGPYACTQVGGIQTNYLIGLTYTGRRTMWVSVTDDPNQCVTGTNGEFIAGSAWAAADATKAIMSGAWPTPPPISCEGPSSARLSDVMVPAGSTSLTICAHRAHVITSNYNDLVSALNGLKSHRWIHECTNTGRPGTGYWLIFGYPAGPPATVDVNTGCRPQVENGSLQADSAGNVVSIIKRLGAGH
jgi:hypothetical protein